jgi:hypothetical protein
MTISVVYGRENFPSEYGPQGAVWTTLFNAHGQEVRGRNMKIFWNRYYAIERDRRLVWIVARDEETATPIGYSCHWWYIDMHFGDKVATDDLWYVIPAARKLGIGRRLKEIGLACLVEAGVQRTYDMIRTDGPWQAMKNLGYYESGIRWSKDLTDERK